MKKKLLQKNNISTKKNTIETTFERVERYRASIFSILQKDLDDGGGFSFYEGGVSVQFASFFNKKYLLTVNCCAVTSIKERTYEGYTVDECLDLAFMDLERYLSCNVT